MTGDEVPAERAELLAAVRAGDDAIDAVWAEWPTLPRNPGGWIDKDIRDAFYARLEQAQAARAEAARQAWAYLGGRGDYMTHTPNSSDPADAYLDAMRDKTAKRLGELGGSASKAVMNEAGFDWRPADTQAAIAARFRALPDDTDLDDALVRVICATLSDHQVPHDPDAVRRAVARHLDEDTSG